MSLDRREAGGHVRVVLALSGTMLMTALFVSTDAPRAAAPAAQHSRQSVSISVGEFHGGYVLSASALRAIASPGPPSISEEAKEQEPPPSVMPAQAACASALCSVPSGPRLRLKKSPAPTTRAFTAPGGIDPQIAASGKSFLVVGMRQSVWFFDKAGRPLLKRKPSISKAEKPTNPGSSLATFGEVNLCDLFGPLIPAVNRRLRLPTSKTDAEGHPITVHDGYGINCNAKTGGVQPPGWHSDRDFYWPNDEIYDSRVMWDEHHKRFWIVGLFKNSNTVAFPDPATEDPMGLRPSTRSANVRSARRALLAVAVSKTQDPRDGWRLGWTWGVPGETACPTCPGFGSDYLAMGISSRYATLESAGGTIGDGSGRRVITIIPTGPVIHGSDTPVYQPDRNELGSRLFQPALQHAPDYDHARDVFLATPIYDKDNGLAGDTIQLTVVAPAGSGGGSPDLFQQNVHVHLFHAVWSTDSSGHTSGDMLAAQKRGPGVTGHPTLSVAQNWVNKLVSRGSSLYLTMDECKQWTARDCALSAIRFVRIHLGTVTRSHGRITHIGTTVVSDETVSGADPAHPADSASFGFPAVDVNAKRNAVISYDGTSSAVYPQARYSVWFARESDVRSSRVLKKGQSTLGSSDNGWHAGWHHYLGMSVDTFDGHGIWLINGYANASHGWSYAIGKVLGRRVADPAVVRAAVVHKGVSGARTYRVTFDVANLGDGTAPARSVRISLTHPESPDVNLGSQAVPKLKPGSRVSLSVVVTAPPVAGYDVIGISVPTMNLPEYDTGNNVAYVSLPH